MRRHYLTNKELSLPNKEQNRLFLLHTDEVKRFFKSKPLPQKKPVISSEYVCQRMANVLHCDTDLVVKMFLFIEEKTSECLTQNIGVDFKTPDYGDFFSIHTYYQPAKFTKNENPASVSYPFTPTEEYPNPQNLTTHRRLSHKYLKYVQRMAPQILVSPKIKEELSKKSEFIKIYRLTDNYIKNNNYLRPYQFKKITIENIKSYNSKNNIVNPSDEKLKNSYVFHETFEESFRSKFMIYCNFGLGKFLMVYKYVVMELLYEGNLVNTPIFNFAFKDYSMDTDYVMNMNTRKKRNYIKKIAKSHQDINPIWVLIIAPSKKILEKVFFYSEIDKSRRPMYEALHHINFMSFSNCSQLYLKGSDFTNQ